uniref:Uncharacterized protein n=1 Tax=Steinernema glaseri TaxID=37863 RepID=A0A1I7ZWH8_9BILA
MITYNEIITSVYNLPPIEQLETELRETIASTTETMIDSVEVKFNLIDQLNSLWMKFNEQYFEITSYRNRILSTMHGIECLSEALDRNRRNPKYTLDFQKWFHQLLPVVDPKEKDGIKKVSRDHNPWIEDLMNRIDTIKDLITDVSNAITSTFHRPIISTIVEITHIHTQTVPPTMVETYTSMAQDEDMQDSDISRSPSFIIIDEEMNEENEPMETAQHIQEILTTRTQEEEETPLYQRPLTSNASSSHHDPAFIELERKFINKILKGLEHDGSLIIEKINHWRHSLNSRIPSKPIRPDIACIFCGRYHYTEQCFIYQEIDERRRMIQEFRRCEMCLYSRDHTRCSKADTPCRHCFEYGHHQALCMSTRDMQNKVDHLKKEDMVIRNLRFEFEERMRKITQTNY